MTSERRRKPAVERQEQLVAATSRLLAQIDIDALSVQQIAQEAGVSDGLLYHYFGSKDALVAETLHRLADQMFTALRATAHEGTAVERLQQGMAVYFEYVEENQGAWRALLRAHGSDAFAAAADQFDTASEQLIFENLGLGEPSDVTRAAVAAWLAYERAVCLQWLEGRIGRPVLEQLLAGAALASLTVAAESDPQLAAALAIQG